MYKNIRGLFFIIIILFTLAIVRKRGLSVKPPDENQAFKIYEVSCGSNEYHFFAAQKFSEAETIMPEVEQSAKALLMSGFSNYQLFTKKRHQPLKIP